MMAALRDGLEGDAAAVQAMRAAATPAALAGWDAAAGQNWIVGAKKKLKAQASLGLWWEGRVRLRPSDRDVVGFAARACTAEEAAVRVREVLGKEATVEWAPRDAAVEAAGGGKAEVEHTPVAVGRMAVRRAAAGGGVRARAEAMILSGLVLLNRDHAVAVYPPLFTRGGASRAIAAARAILAASPAKTTQNGLSEEKALNVLRGSPSEGRIWVVLAGEAWVFRPRAGAGKRLARALVLPGREDDARALLEAAFGELEVWRPDRPKLAQPAHSPKPTLPMASSEDAVRRLTQAWRRLGGVLPFSSTALHRLCGGRGTEWSSEKVVRADLAAATPSQVQAALAATAPFTAKLDVEFRTAPKGKLIPAIVPGLGAVGREALEKALGQRVLHYRELPDPVAQDAPAPEASVTAPPDKTDPVAAVPSPVPDAPPMEPARSDPASPPEPAALDPALLGLRPTNSGDLGAPRLFTPTDLLAIRRSDRPLCRMARDGRGVVSVELVEAEFVLNSAEVADAIFPEAWIWHVPISPNEVAPHGRWT
jgi:hypothetical protein